MMLTFEDFHSDDDVFGCVLWASETVMGRVRFNIGRKILQDELDGANPVHSDVNVALCEKERPRIEAACRHASRPSERIDPQPSDFHAS
jgi:hypothetical protein